MRSKTFLSILLTLTATASKMPAAEYLDGRIRGAWDDQTFQCLLSDTNSGAPSLRSYSCRRFIFTGHDIVHGADLASCSNLGERLAEDRWNYGLYTASHVLL